MSDSILGLFLTTPIFFFLRLSSRHDRLLKGEECRLQVLLRSLQVFLSLVWPIWIAPTRLDTSYSRICRFAMKENTGFVLPCMRRPRRRLSTRFRQILWSRRSGPRTGWMLSPRHSLFSLPRSFLDWLKAPLYRELWLSRVAVFVSDEMLG